MSDTPPVILWGLTVVTAFVIGVVYGLHAEQDRLKKEIVSRGFGDYVLVDGGPKTEFQWKPPIRKTAP